MLMVLGQTFIPSMQPMFKDLRFHPTCGVVVIVDLEVCEAHTFLLHARGFGNFAYDNLIQVVCTSHVAAQHDTESILGIPILGTMNCLFTKGICSLPWLSVEQVGLLTVINLISLTLVQHWSKNVSYKGFKVWTVKGFTCHPL